MQHWLVLGAFFAAMGSVQAVAADGAGRITGIGGIFVKAKDPRALAAWYRDVLGVPVQAWGGAVFRSAPPVQSWSAFTADSDYFAPSTRDVMVNFTVDDIDAVVARLAAHGVAVIRRDDSDEHGRFAWVLDPEGTKIELWQPK